MRWIDIFRIAIRMLTVNFLRTLLTCLGIATAIALIVVLTGLGYGVQGITIGSIVQSKSLLSLTVSAPTDSGTTLDNDTFQAIKSLPEVQDISPIFETDGQVIFNNKLVSNNFNAVTVNFFAMEGVRLSQGSMFHEDKPEIIISPQTIDLLGLRPSDILGKTITFKYSLPNGGQELYTFDTPLTVVGITNGSDSTAMFIPFNLIKDKQGVAMTSIKVTAKNRDSLIALEDRLTQRGYSVETLLATLDQARRVFRDITIGLVVIAAIALVIAAIGMLNTLTITLLERTREIGIMKAIGITNKDVERLFLAESILLGVMGGIVGVGAGLAVDAVANKALNFFATRYGGTALELFSYPQWFLASMILYPAILGALTGLYPAIRASRLNPLRALRYE